MQEAANKSTRQEYQRGAQGHTSVFMPDPIVSRYTIDPSASAEIAGTYIGKENLHPIERALFNKAIANLGRHKSADMYNADSDHEIPPENVVLVDTFARDSNGVIKINDDGLPETHIVALWQKSDREIVLIDPNNVSYTKDLSVGIAALTRDTIACSCIQVTGGQIYNALPPGQQTQEQYKRDCIDVAVKIAFELNDLQQTNVPLSKIESTMLYNISNQEKVLRTAATQIPDVQIDPQILKALKENQEGASRATLSSDRGIKDETRKVMQRVDVSHR